eukprot:ctg_478.g243
MCVRSAQFLHARAYTPKNLIASLQARSVVFIGECMLTGKTQRQREPDGDGHCPSGLRRRLELWNEVVLRVWREVRIGPAAGSAHRPVFRGGRARFRLRGHIQRAVAADHLQPHPGYAALPGAVVRHSERGPVAARAALYDRLVVGHHRLATRHRADGGDSHRHAAIPGRLFPKLGPHTHHHGVCHWRGADGDAAAGEPAVAGARAPPRISRVLGEPRAAGHPRLRGAYLSWVARRPAVDRILFRRPAGALLCGPLLPRLCGGVHAPQGALGAHLQRKLQRGPSGGGARRPHFCGRPVL